MKMKCIQVEEVGSFKIRRIPIRKPANEEVTIKVEVTGLCRTDLKIIRVGHRDLLLPRIPGEEVVGTVYEKGSDVTNVTEGDMVYVYPGSWCGNCHACKNGTENLCRDMKIMGFHRDGGFAEYVTVPAKSVIHVPKNITPEEAVFAEPLSCCLNALELGGIREGKRIGIWGAGPAGTLLSRASEARGAESFTIDPDPVRCARIGGFEYPPDQKFDICIVAVGSRRAYEEAMICLKPHGCLVIFSGLPKPDERIDINFNTFHYLEQKIAGAYGCLYRHGHEALDYISNGSIPVKDMISHRMSLWQLDEALGFVENREGMKIHLYPW